MAAAHAVNLLAIMVIEYERAWSNECVRKSLFSGLSSAPGSGGFCSSCNYMFPLAAKCAPSPAGISSGTPTLERCTKAEKENTARLVDSMPARRRIEHPRPRRRLGRQREAGEVRP